MDDRLPANERVHEHIRQATRDGHVWPGAGLDTAAIARAFNTTPIEVQCALLRLVGAGLLVDDPRYRLRAFVFRRIRRALQCGRYRPAEPLEPTAMAQAYGSGRSVIRFALYRLLGEEVVELDAARAFRVPPITEAVLLDHYDFAQWCTDRACNLLAVLPREPSPATTTATGVSEDTDLPTQTTIFFEQMPPAAGSVLPADIGRMNCLLGPVRPAEFALIPDASAELSQLQEAWQRRDLKALKAALSNYLARRRRMAADVVELLSTTPPASRR